MGMKGQLHEAFGESKTLRQWSEDPRCVVTLSQLNSRVGLGWGLARALTTPQMHKQSVSTPRLPGNKGGRR